MQPHDWIWSVAGGAQFIVAIHSPIPMRSAAAVIYEFGDDGPQRVTC